MINNISSTLETTTSYSTSYTTKMTSRDQNGNLVKTHRDSSLPPPIRKSKLISESPTSTQPIPPPRKHVSISQSNLLRYPSDNNRIYSNYNHEIINDDRHLPLRTSNRPTSRQSHLNTNSIQRASHLNYDESSSDHYASQRINNNPLSPGPNSNSNYYYRNLHQGQTLPTKKSPYSNYAFHIPTNFNRYGFRSSSASYDKFGRHALDRANLAQTTQAIPDMVTTAERQQIDYERETPRKIMLSEGNLLTAHIETIRDDGRDNPFKPGTELSWEADLMVKLYKKGHPLSQVPVLLEKIKRQLEENKSLSNLDRLNSSSNEINNNNNDNVIVNKSRTISNDLCNIARASDQLRNNRKFNNITSSEKRNDIKIPIDDGIIESIISKLDRKDNTACRDNSERENQENDAIDISRKEESHLKVANKAKLPPAIVNIPRKDKKKDSITNDRVNETKIKKSSSLEPISKKNLEKTTSKAKKGRILKGKNTYDENGANSQSNAHNGSKEVVVKRRNCCSIQ